MSNISVLLIDVGNTASVIGYFDGKRVSRITTIATSPRFNLSASIIRSLVKMHPTAAIISCVVPRLIPEWNYFINRKLNISLMQLNYQMSIGIPISYPHPETIGTDRLANASAAASQYGAPLIVADFGTALTFDVVVRNRGYIGGVIAPGLPLMFDYLADKTALLPKIKPYSVKRAIGKNTKDAMCLGARWGYRGMVREILLELSRNIRGKPMVCATGGYAPWVLRGFQPHIPVDPDLTLNGLAKIYLLNSNN